MSNQNEFFDKHLKTLSNDVVKKLIEIKDLVQALVPQAELTSSYGVPAFKINGKSILMFAGFKNHIGLYPYAQTIEEFKKELSEYELSKGTIRLPADNPIPTVLIEKLVKYNLKNVEK